MIRNDYVRDTAVNQFVKIVSIILSNRCDMKFLDYESKELSFNKKFLKITYYDYVGCVASEGRL